MEVVVSPREDTLLLFRKSMNPFRILDDVEVIAHTPSMDVAIESSSRRHPSVQFQDRFPETLGGCALATEDVLESSTGVSDVNGSPPALAMDPLEFKEDFIEGFCGVHEAYEDDYSSTHVSDFLGGTSYSSVQAQEEETTLRSPPHTRKREAAIAAQRGTALKKGNKGRKPSS